ncbi:hypothetical protein SARC_06761 [Sphaeroforma arctica JP610]|uniref:EGF-like domain-containing protein n=1 Tax=Sphaeroforma arctica JP610 TaxID=667725 RepID=A0A0L0FWE4_9EUKA|nr:hypothetical protein SARC_06761 [Sphaeroforma arctica JP610]KNC80891.1 hypothetical protein SARC_06761 [Sphaeroforma arctica JP610]|eukprot:XP_014154793.1 hypothetical protein SARC_06761 [Sphaeroforma arctica JP610]
MSSSRSGLMGICKTGLFVALLSLSLVANSATGATVAGRQVAECDGHGHLHDEECHCDEGYELAVDNVRSCVMAECGGHGHLHGEECHCDERYVLEADNIGMCVMVYVDSEATALMTETDHETDDHEHESDDHESETDDHEHESDDHESETDDHEHESDDHDHEDECSGHGHTHGDDCHCDEGYEQAADETTSCVLIEASDVSMESTEDVHETEHEDHDHE